MKKAITHLKLNNANQTKLDKLDILSVEYMALVQSYTDHIFDNDLREVTKYDPIPPVDTPLSERWKRCAWQQAAGIMKSFFSNGRTNKPVLFSTTIQGSPNVIVIEPSESSTFDYWLRISTLDKGRPIRVPVTLYDKARQALAEGRLCSGVTLNKQAGVWYATFIIDLPRAKPGATGELIGVDLGIVNLVTTSEGEQFGQFSETLKRRVDRATEKRRRKQKLNRCLRKKGLPTVSLVDKKLSRFIRNEIGRAFNQFVKNLEPGVTVVLETLSVKTMRFKSRRMNRILSASQLGYTATRLREKLNFCHIRYRSVVSAYSSQECSECGFVDEKNRRSQATFKCQACGCTLPADVNAGKVLVKRFDDTELSAVDDYRQVKTILLQRFFDRFPAARSVAGGLDTLPLGDESYKRSISPLNAEFIGVSVNVYE